VLIDVLADYVLMSKIIISYDDTSNDRDAAALGRILTTAGASAELAYVRHARETDHERDQLKENEARELLRRGAEVLGNADAPLHVVLDASTGEGLWALAEQENADVIVFGSDYRTARGTVQPGNSARRLLDGGPAAVAIAPAGLHERDQATIATIGFVGDESAATTARNLAQALGATVAEPGQSPVDLLVVGSRPEAQQGRVTLSAAAEYAVETASSAVLVVPHGVALSFGARSTSATTTA
jgi:nucleotide-binding universal stress UspA family protein